METAIAYSRVKAVWLGFKTRRILRSDRLVGVEKQCREIQKYYDEEEWRKDGLPSFGIGNVLQ